MAELPTSSESPRSIMSLRMEQLRRLHRLNNSYPFLPPDPITTGRPLPPPSPPLGDDDPDDSVFTFLSSTGESNITTPSTNSPLDSPPPDHPTFLDSSDALSHPFAHIPFRSSPLASSSVRATIRRINGLTGEMEMEDHEEVDADEGTWIRMDDIEEDDIDTMNPFSDQTIARNTAASGLVALASEGLFRAGTPTPVVTPPFPQTVLPGTHAGNASVQSNTAQPFIHLMQELDGTDIETIASNLDVIDGVLDGVMDDELVELNALEEILDTHEISTEELDTEFLDVRRRNFANSWLRYRYRRPQERGNYPSPVGTECTDRDRLAALMLTRPTEVTEEEFDDGQDIQGLKWGLPDIPDKKDFREKRVKDYGSLIVKPPRSPITVNPAHDPTRIHNFYKFRYTNLGHRCSLHHFQLRYLLSATSRNDLYYIYANSLRRWDSLSRTSEEIYNFRQSRQAPWKGWMPSTLACGHDISAIGGYNGEYAIIPLDQNRRRSMRIGSLAGQHYITNHVDIITPRQGGVSVIWANNDWKIREQNVETGQFVRVHNLKWPINATATSPDGRIRAAVGDAKEVVLMDAQRGDIIKELHGHNHWSFAVDWKNDGYTFVTGNQDMSARLWDARYMNYSFLTLPAKIGAIRSVHFSPDGKYLTLAEPADYVHIYDTTTNLYEEKQTIEFIGEIAGVSFDPSGENLFIGNADDLVGSIYEFKRVRAKEAAVSWEDIML